MIVAIQQPEHLPWVGFFNKMAQCDMFVNLDNVQFKKRYFENRNRLKTAQGGLWLTVPVISKGKYHQKINEVSILKEASWERKYLGRLESSLQEAPYWNDVKNIVFPVFQEKIERLVDLNIALIDGCLQYLGIETETILASNLDTGKAKGSDLILRICREVDANTYISGPDGRTYLELTRFEMDGIDVIYHDFEHPEYPQCYGEFFSHLSVLDIIANCGPNSATIIKECYRVKLNNEIHLS